MNHGYLLLATQNGRPPVSAFRAFARAQHSTKAALELGALRERISSLKFAVHGYLHDIRTAHCPGHGWISDLSHLGPGDALRAQSITIKNMLKPPFLNFLGEVETALQPDTVSCITRYWAETTLRILETEWHAHLVQLAWETRTALLLLPNYKPQLHPLGYAAIDRSLHRVLSLCNQAIGGHSGYRPIDVLPVLTDTVGLFNTSGVEITIHPTHGNARIRGDSYALERVIQNLLSNAHFALQGVEHPRITISTLVFFGRLQVFIRDNGHGIPAGHLTPALAEPGVSTKEGDGIKGMGLAITAEIVRNHGGELHVTSSPGHGTAFVLSFPLATF